MHSFRLSVTLPQHAGRRALGGDHIGFGSIQGAASDGAAEMGPVNRVVPDAQRANVVTRLARHIAREPAVAIRMGKAGLHGQLELGLTDAYAFASGVMTRNMLEAEAHEGIGAFLDKRPPRWE